MITLLSSPPAWRASFPTRWYVIFCDVEKRHWWDRLTRPGFGHVYAVRWDGFNWLLFNPSAAFTHVAIVACTDKNALHRLVEPGATILEVEAFRQANRIRGRWWAGPMTCVEQIKALLGLPVGRVWTPWQLYRHLASLGWPELHDGEQAQNAGAHRAGARARTPCQARARQIDPRGKRTPESDQPRAHRSADFARLR
jgi:hypothetical protein